MTNHSTIYSILAVALVMNVFVTSIESYYDRQKFKALVLNDKSNDDAVNLNTIKLIERSNFRHQVYYVVAKDGYVTQLIRLINPLADRQQLKQPPIMLFHGANIDTSAYLASSSKQHFPEKYPRVEGVDPPFASSKRSLGFALANEGYDVWLIGSRGSNKENRAFVPQSDVPDAQAQGIHFVPDKKMFEFSKKKEYWQYGLDNIIAYDIGRQIDTVKQVTGSNEVSIFSFSLSAPTTMAFLGYHDDYAQNVRAYIQMAPAIAADHKTFISKVYFEKICPRLDTKGVGFTPTFWVKPAAKKVVMTLSKSYDVRYGFIRKLLNSLFGYSQKYQTNLELNVLARIFKNVSFKSIQQYCQSSVSKKLNRFDYGSEMNMVMYGQVDPPEHDISQLLTQNWLVISGTYDVLADSTTVSRVIETTITFKRHTIQVPGYNHLDMIAGVEVDKYVVEPIIQYLNRLHTPGVNTNEQPYTFANGNADHNHGHVADDDDEEERDDDDGYNVHIN